MNKLVRVLRNLIFDFTQAETCELVGIYIFSQLKEIPHGMEIGLYRDDGLGVIDQTPQKIKKNQKKNSAKCSLKTTYALLSRPTKRS